jgi:hypothetical protein
MCWMWDNPGAAERDYLAHLREVICMYGWAVQAVERHGIHPPWAYTVGLTATRRPELVVTGMGAQRATHLLNGMAAHLAHADPPDPGTSGVMSPGPLIEIVEVTKPWAHLNMAVALYGDAIRALQLVHADDRGHWPWDAYFRGTRGGQPVLGVRAPEDRRKRIG